MKKSTILITISIIATLGFWGGIAYIAWHFISKYW